MYPRNALIVVISIWHVFSCIESICAVKGKSEARRSDRQVEGASKPVPRVGGAPKRAPKDYPQSFTDSRVKDLIGFFELVNQSVDDPHILKESNSVLSLPEALSKLHVLTHGQSVDIRCSKYLKLLTRSNIRTVATISMLMKEARSFSETDQLDANLMSKLENDRKFDALARIQVILQSLESEKTSGKSDIDPNVQRDLLDCINYFIYRHQRATTNVVQHVRQLVEELPMPVKPTETELALKKLSESVDEIKSIESAPGDQFRYDDWLLELTKISKLARDANYEIPQQVRDFLTESKRVARLNLIDRGRTLTAKILKLEASGGKLEENEDYVASLIVLQDVCQDHSYALPKQTCALLRDPRRSRLIPIQGLGNEVTELPADEYDLSPSQAEYEYEYESELQSESEHESDYETATETGFETEDDYAFRNEAQPAVKFGRAKTGNGPAEEGLQLRGNIWQDAPVEKLPKSGKVDEPIAVSARKPKKVRSTLPQDPFDTIYDKELSDEIAPTLSEVERNVPKKSKKIQSKDKAIDNNDDSNNIKKKKKSLKKQVSKKDKDSDTELSVIGPGSMRCIYTLNDVKKFLIKYGDADFHISEVRRVSNQLSAFKAECLGEDMTEEESLEDSLKDWCGKNPHLLENKDCTTVLEVLD